MYSSSLQKIKFLFYKSGINDIRDVIHSRYMFFLKQRRQISFKNGQLPLPSEITWELTYRCNLDCQMCFQRKVIQGKELNTADIQKIVAALSPMCKKMNLTGGEIFVRKDIFEIMRILEKKGIKVFIVTNGTLLDKEKVELLVNFKNIIGIQFSLDGSKEIHNKIRRSPYAFDQANNAINLLCNRLRISLSCVITAENAQDLTSVLELARDLKIRNVNYSFEYFNTTQEWERAKKILENAKILNVKIRNNYLFDIVDMEMRVKQLKRIARSYGIGIIISPQITSRYFREYLSSQSLYNLRLSCGNLAKGRIDPYGNVTFCQSIRKKFGNLTEKSFQEIWHGKDFIRFRREIHSKLSSNPVCRRCCRLEST